jgi:hypothetical protein
MMPNKRPVPLGKPLKLSDKQLEELAQVTPVDIEKASAFWKAHVSKKFRTLLDAEVMEDKQNGSTATD